MLSHERLQVLRELLTGGGSVVVSDLARQWGVSEMTVRRDLRRLADEGVAARVHGGAVAAGALRFHARADRDRKAKAAAAAKLASLLDGVSSLYLDGSTTVHHLVEHLRKRSGLVVATGNTDTFMALAACPGVEAVLIGGRLDRETDNLVGPLARRALAGLAFDLACFSAYALDPDIGPSEPAIEDAELKELVCSRAARHALAVNARKLGLRAAGAWELPAGSILATDLDPDDRRLAPYAGRFAEIR